MVRHFNIRLSATFTFLTVLVSTAFSSLLLGNPDDPENDNAIFFLGKWFYKNGKSGILSIEPEQWFDQCMDHFKANGCNKTWKQRFWVKKDYYKEGGPIFLQLGGEASADGYIDDFYWGVYAQHYGALMIALEHRFFGESWPSRDFTNIAKTFQLLTSQQALADAAYFIDSFTASNQLQGSEWVAFGGSYAGRLAAWLKQKYPNHVKTAVASSAPLLSVYGDSGYMETVSEVVKAIDRNCFDIVHKIFGCIESLVNGSNYHCGPYHKPSELLPALHQCYTVDFEDKLEPQKFFFNIGYNPWASNWPSALATSDCETLMGLKSGTDIVKLYGKFLVEVGAGNTDCNLKLRAKDPTANSKILTGKELLSFIDSDDGIISGATGWLWLTCHELGSYAAADPKYGLFGYHTWSGDAEGSQCLHFGKKFTPHYIKKRVAFTNKYYKGKDIDAKCVIFVNGSWDPWHSLGITRASETSSDNTVVFIPRAEHCRDMNMPEDDPIASDETAKAQDLIQTQIGIYLNDDEC